MWSLVSFSDSSANSQRVAEQLLLTRNLSMENLEGRSFPARNFPPMTNDDTVPEVQRVVGEDEAVEQNCRKPGKIFASNR